MNQATIPNANDRKSASRSTDRANSLGWSRLKSSSLLSKILSSNPICAKQLGPVYKSSHTHTPRTELIVQSKDQYFSNICKRNVHMTKDICLRQLTTITRPSISASAIRSQYFGAVVILLHITFPPAVIDRKNRHSFSWQRWIVHIICLVACKLGDICVYVRGRGGMKSRGEYLMHSHCDQY